MTSAKQKQITSISLLTVIFLVGGSVLPQDRTARIVGTITDVSGAVIPGVEVIVSNVATEFGRSVVAADNGTYTILALPVGEYRLEAALPGFKREVLTGIILQVGQIVRLDLTLEIGDISEEVTVESLPALVQSESASVSTVIDQQKVHELPLNGRFWMQLATLTPGIMQGTMNDLQSVFQGRTVDTVSGVGLRAEFTSTKLDGIENSTLIEKWSGAVQPSIDSIAEFSVQTSNYGTESGHAGGPVVRVVTKSGTNEYHGTIFEFHRNAALDARNFFDQTGDTAPLVQNQFGGAIGGPIVKNKAFFFFNYEGVRIRRGSERLTLVPTQQEKAGDFSGQATIFDPATIREDPGNPGTFIADPFPGNVIPQSRMDPVAVDVLTFYPSPNLSGDPTNNFFKALSNPDDSDQYNVRIDYTAGDKDEFFFRGTIQDRENIGESIFEKDVGGSDREIRGRSAVIGWTRVFSPNVINEFRFGVTRSVFNNRKQNSNNDRIQELSFAEDAFAGTTDPALLKGFPSFNISGMESINEAGGARDEYDNQWQWINTVSYTTADHSWEFGVEYTADQFGQSLNAFTLGDYRFNGLFTSVPLAAEPALGHGLPDFLLGISNFKRRATFGVQELTKYFENKNFAFSISDRWHVSPGLSLTLGIRYWVSQAAKENNGLVSNFDLASGLYLFADTPRINEFLDSIDSESGNTVADEVPFIFSRNGPTNLHETDKNNWQPTIGFAWRPFGDNRTVVRSAYSVYHIANHKREILAAGVENPPFFSLASFSSDPVFPTLDPLVEGVPLAGIATAWKDLSIFMAARNLVNPYIQQWNLGIQTQLGNDFVVSGQYVGNKGVHLDVINNENQAFPPAAGDLDPREPFPGQFRVNMQSSRGDSQYHGGLFSAEKRYSQGSMFLFSYTLGKVIGDKSTVWPGGRNDSVFVQNREDFRAEKSRLAMDIRHLLSFSYSYELPFGRNQKFGAGVSGLLNGLIGGWQINGIVSAHTGDPFTIGGGAITNTGAASARPDRVCDGILSSGRTLERDFDTSCFEAPPSFTFGNAGRNIVEHHGLANWDFSITKKTPVSTLGEAGNIEFRAEFFNLTNTPPLGTAGRSFGRTGFGVISSAGFAREIQLSLRISF